MIVVVKKRARYFSNLFVTLASIGLVENQDVDMEFDEIHTWLVWTSGISSCKGSVAVFPIVRVQCIFFGLHRPAETPGSEQKAKYVAASMNKWWPLDDDWVERSFWKSLQHWWDIVLHRTFLIQRQNMRLQGPSEASAMHPNPTSIDVMILFHYASSHPAEIKPKVIFTFQRRCSVSFASFLPFIVYFLQNA